MASRMAVSKETSFKNKSQRSVESAFTAQNCTISPNQIRAFLLDLQEKGCVEGTLKKYGHDLTTFYHYLPKKKQVGPDTLLAWRRQLVARGYAAQTINGAVSAVNSFLEYLGRREFQLQGQLKLGAMQRPELTREEYWRLLETAWRLQKEKTYLLIKLFACTGLAVQDLPRVTLEAVRAGILFANGQNGTKPLRLPAGLCRELLAYAQRNCIQEGPLFVTKKGEPLGRTYVADSIRRLCCEAGVAKEKGNPRCLRRLYQTMQTDIAANIERLMQNAYQQLLESEQLRIGWVQLQKERVQGTS